MNKKRKFIEELYKNRINKIPFLEHFQKDKNLRNILFKSFLNQKPNEMGILHFSEIKELKLLNEISVEFEDFENLVLNERKFDSKDKANCFTKNIFNKFRLIGIPNLTRNILIEFRGVLKEKGYSIIHNRRLLRVSNLFHNNIFN